jgi:ATP-dependent Clp protease ATP-binding subunit ClpA
MFEKFSESSREVLVEAQGVAVEMGSRWLTAGHLLYGCAEVRDDSAGRPLRAAGVTGGVIRRTLPRGEDSGGGPVDPEALRAVGIDYGEFKAAVDETFGAGALESAPDRRNSSGRVRRPRFTPEAKRSLELGLRVALELHAKRIQPGHLLLGLLRLDDDFVTGTLEQAGSTVGQLSATVLTELESN